MADDNYQNKAIVEKLCDSSKGQLLYEHKWSKDRIIQCLTDDSLQHVVKEHCADDRHSHLFCFDNNSHVSSEAGSTSETNDTQNECITRPSPSPDLPSVTYTPFELKDEKDYQRFIEKLNNEDLLHRRESLSEKIKFLEHQKSEQIQMVLDEKQRLQEIRANRRKEFLIRQETLERELMEEAESQMEARIQAYKHQEMEVRKAAWFLEAKKKEHISTLFSEVEHKVRESFTALSEVLEHCSDKQRIAVLQQRAKSEAEMLRAKLSKSKLNYDEDKHHLMINEVNRFGHFVGTVKQEVHRVNEAVEEEKRKRLEEEERLRKMKEQQEMERKKKEVELVKPNPTTPPSSILSTESTAASSGGGQSWSNGVAAHYHRLQEKRKQVEKTVEPLTTTTDNKLKNYRFNLQKAVNTPVNSISTQSSHHLKDKVVRLCSLLEGRDVEVTGVTVSTKTHPLGLEFCLNLLAKKFVNQGEKQVSSHFEAAFPIAAVILGVWSRHPNLGDFLLSHFHDVCPILVPLQVPTPPKISEKDFKKLLSYRSNNNGLEDDSDYLKRMSGVVRLYAALVQSPSVVWGKDNPLGIGNGWRWFALMLNTDPLPGITATALFDFLEVAGHALLKEYKSQFEKILYVLAKNYLPRIEAVTAAGQGGPTARLKQFLEKCIQSGSIPTPKGVLPPALWRS